MGLSASHTHLLNLVTQRSQHQPQPQPNNLDKTKLARDNARLSDEYNKAVGGNNPNVDNNPTVENKEIPADDILGIMDAMSRNVNTTYNTFK